jgi:hypothetical protein
MERAKKAPRKEHTRKQAQQIPAVNKTAFDNVLDRLLQTAPLPREQVRPSGQAPRPLIQKTES